MKKGQVNVVKLTLGLTGGFSGIILVAVGDAVGFPWVTRGGIALTVFSIWLLTWWK